ncbi:MAG TPA: haloacid dehalogenase-like hydrolase [Gaiellaceae bacterium]|nr:haloacid dehalogenase-like hydrolase [Gaiellaceae bacterium]
MSGPAAVLVWDLDGTLYRGTAACRHYAEGIAATLEPERREAYLEAVDRFLGGAGGVDAADGWEAAVMLAGGARGHSRAYADAFARTRAFMLDDACALEVPDGLRSFLERTAGSVRRVLVSNTPSFGVMPLLRRLELLDLLDEIVCDAAKPNRFSVRLRAFADVNGLPRESVLSIGDHFVNDIEPALAAGCATAYLDPFGVGPSGRAELEAARIEDLWPAIEEWVDGRRVPVAAGAVAR